MWVVIPLIAAVLYALTDFTENYIVDTHCKKLNPNCMKVVYLGFDLVVMIAFAIWQWPNLFTGISLSTIMILIAAGAVGAIGGVFYYRVLKKDDTTGMTLLGQMEPVIALLLGAVLLQQIPTAGEVVALLMILGAMILLVKGAGKKIAKTRFSAGLFMSAACLFWVLGDVIFVTQGEAMDFWVGLFWLSLGGFMMDVCLSLAMKSWRKDARLFWRGKKAKKVIALIAVEITVWLADAAWMFGVLVVPVALMSAVGGAMSLIVTFILGVILTILWPKFGREKLNKKMVLNHALATGILAVAVVMIG